jgi:hypothetical protein
VHIDSVQFFKMSLRALLPAATRRSHGVGEQPPDSWPGR